MVWTRCWVGGNWPGGLVSPGTSDRSPRQPHNIYLQMFDVVYGTNLQTTPVSGAPTNCQLVDNLLQWSGQLPSPRRQVVLLPQCLDLFCPALQPLLVNSLLSRWTSVACFCGHYILPAGLVCRLFCGRFFVQMQLSAVCHVF